jgi:negative regulator of replication initiation
MHQEQTDSVNSNQTCPKSVPRTPMRSMDTTATQMNDDDTYLLGDISLSAI